VRVDGRGGRPLAEGMDVLARTDLSGAGVLAISLFTNDAPTETGALEAAVRATLARAGPRGCVVWATIVRPPLDGVSYNRANALLERLATRDRRLRLVPWARRVAAQPRLMGPDGVHPTPAGYALRAAMYARAARSCG
jgi:lysophospholipase L1-like esterase